MSEMPSLSVLEVALVTVDSLIRDADRKAERPLRGPSTGSIQSLEAGYAAKFLRARREELVEKIKERKGQGTWA